MGKRKGSRTKHTVSAYQKSTKPPHQNQQEQRPQQQLSARFNNSTRSGTTTKQQQLRQPQLEPFPHNLPKPRHGGFLRDESPYRESYHAALSTAYKGFCCDENVLDEAVSSASTTTTTATTKQAIQQCLVNDMATIFRTDVTQPFGLGTPCAKTYVTRCLLGDKGTTYKYLGLRMFAHAWPKEIDSLRARLTEQTRHHLHTLSQARPLRGGERRNNDDSSSIDAGEFDICLVNRMVAQPNLKVEPLSKEKITVSWHADSSLEHYSTISVYQLIVSPEETTATPSSHRRRQTDDESPQECSNDEWSVAMRVAMNAEGPHANSAIRPIHSGPSIDGTSSNKDDNDADDESKATIAPPIAVRLPSNSAYYMLDDFNHHHQHTVLTSQQTPESIRYSCTFRRLRDSHNVAHVLERCRRCIGQFHKKGKVYRTEQLLLTYLESEWIRQFYIQGQRHYTALWESGGWRQPMSELLSYWSQLETRTYLIINFLRLAAHGKCHSLQQDGGGAAGNLSNKERKKQAKALAMMNDLLQREQQVDSGAIYFESLASLLRERSEMRRLWTKRGNDHVFHTLEKEDRPLPVPFNFREADCGGSSSSDAGPWRSPLPGSPEQMNALAKELQALGKAFCSGQLNDLPDSGQATSNPSENQHAQPSGWKGWSDGNKAFGLELQQPWADALLNGRKTIETRGYDLPQGLLGKRIWILASPEGKAGVSAMKDKVHSAHIVGWCTFVKVILYKDARTFEKDETAHLVESSSPYGWKHGQTQIIFGWVVGTFSCTTTEQHSGIRRFRSLYQLTPALVSQGDSQSKKVRSNKQGSPKRKKKRRF